MLQGDAKWGAYYHSQAFILPSHQENFGIVVAEALACGKPVLISNKVNIWREVVAAGAGLVADDTAAGAAGIMQQWLAKTASEQAAMGEAASALFASHYTIDASCRSLLGVLQRAIESQKGG